MDLGQRIRQARLNAGLSQEVLASRMGLTRNAVSMWESGKTRPATAQLLKIPQITNVDPYWLFANEAPEVIRVPIVDSVSAGRLAHGQQIERWEDFDHLPVAGLAAGDWIALKVDGNSMNRVAQSGSFIIVDVKDKALISDRYYVIATDDGSTFKKFKARPARFEPDTTEAGHETIFPEGTTIVTGRVKKIYSDV